MNSDEKNLTEELMGLKFPKPKLSMEKVCNTLNDIAETAKSVYKNSIDDIDYLFGEARDCVEGCGANLDNARLRLTHRGIQYLTTTIEILSKNHLLPTEFIYYIYTLVAEDIARDPKPKLFHFQNPYEAIWDKESPESPKLIEVDPEKYIPNPNNESWLFIHGMLYKGMNHDGTDIEQIDLNIYDFYGAFEAEAEMFKEGPNANIDIYLVSYDSEMNKTEREVMEKAIKGNVIASVEAFLFLLVAAVYWREMKDRADKTGEYILPFLKRLKGNSGKVITHSLGCHVLAHAGQKIHHIDNMGESFKEWWCMNAALPSDAFSNTGDFNRAPYIADYYEDGKRTGTRVWYSLSDIVLMMIYPLATYHTALGQTGAGISRQENFIEDIDLTNITEVYHAYEGEYINRLGNCIRNFHHSETDKTC
ncbi:hypothetical protein P9W87_15815 [Bacillus thuringiensis]|uniref:hypothetical protein n=1 Tax=Bacillus thuringiensis TaxID=1428 RepID=UPI002DBF19C4|nr:hypothetical protein [Bacillus thuringiensis]MEC2472689.1 hypothetical protein [Bacillus thuringiensis]